MKRILRYAALTAASAALLAACNKVSEPLPQDGTVMHVTIPSDVTKVSLTDRTASGGGMALAWEAGDAIRVISGSNAELFSIKEGFSGHAADFTGNAVEGSAFDIIYPGTFATLADVTAYSYANQAQTGNGNADHLVYHTWLTGVDAYDKVAFSPDWATAHGGTLHQCGVLKMVVTLPSEYAAVKRIALEAPTEIFCLDNAGAVKSASLALSLSDVDVSASEQILTAYLNVPAQDIALAAGLELTVKVTAADDNVYSQSFTVENDVVMQGGKLSIIRLEPEVVTILTDYYVSVTGAGEKTGVDADNAIDVNQLKSLLRTVVTGEENPSGQAVSDANAAKLDGATFHFADGTYVLPDAANENGLKIEYNGYSKQVDLTFVGSKDAILSGDGQYRVLLLGNQTNLTIKGMTIANGYRGSDNGGGIHVAAGGSGDATLTLEGTFFDNNKTATASNSGGAIRCSKGTVVATDCEFGTGNYARNGGSVYTDNDAAHVTFTGCTFKSHSFNTGGAANNSKGTQIYKNCLFEGCYTETEKGNGGAIHANAVDAVVTVEGCRFHSCKASTATPMASSTNKGAGIISVQRADFTIDNCVFEDCEAVTGALIFLQAGGSGEASGGWFKCNNTKFIGNRASDRGLIQANGSKSNKQGSIGFFNNCVFYNNTMRTNQWGFILHGGNPGIACFNNCTIYGNERQQEGGNGVLLNNDGLIIFTNSTLIGAADLVAVRNTDTSNNASVLLANSLIINTSTVENPLVFGPLDKMKCPLYAYNNIMGPAIDGTDVNLTESGNIYDATLASLGTSAFDTEKNVYTWNGPAESFTKITPAGFETAVKESLNMKYDGFNAYIGDNTLGEFYYGWLSEIGALGKDALGTVRGDAWWPGAYQK